MMGNERMEMIKGVRGLEVMGIYRIPESGVYSIIWGVDIPGRGFGEGFFTFKNGARYGKPAESIEGARRMLENRLGSKWNLPFMSEEGWLQEYLVYYHTEQPTERGGCF